MIDQQAGGLDPVTVQALVISAQKGDRPAFDTLWSTVDKQTYRFCCRSMENVVDAEDAYQETKVAAFQFLKRFDPAYKFSTWVFAIARNKCRKSKPRLKGSFEWDDRLGWWHKVDQDAAPGRMPTRSIEDEGAPEIADSESLNLFADLETQDQVCAIVATAERVLTPPEFAVWVLRDVEDLTEHEAAIKLNRDKGTIKSWLHRARQKIRAAMEQKFEFSAWALNSLQGLPDNVQRRLGEEVAFGVESIGELWVDRPFGGVERTSDRARIVQHASAKARVKVRHARRAIENKPQFRAWVLVEVVGLSLVEASTILSRPQPTVKKMVSQARIKVKRTDVSHSFKGGKRNSK
ncbi:MAG: RNA polymerase sigma factor [Methanoregulaceae archaeon]|nr:RNA polymerase sigma factor [Methanoregulaceae archaeon]